MVWGTIIGGIGSGLSNIFGKKGRRRRQRRRQRRRERRGIRHERQMDQGEQFGEMSQIGAQRAEEAYGLQRGLYDQYGAMARGEGPSLAEAQMRAGMQENVVNQMGLAAAGRGGNLASQARAASAAGAAGGVAQAQNAAQIRAQEQQQAMAAQAALAQGMGAQAQQLQLGGAGMGLQHGLGQRGLDLQQLDSARNLGLGIANVAGNVAGSVGGAVASDERVKQNVRDSELTATEVVGRLKPKKFEYKPGFGSPGERVGIMAQDLEKTPAGQSIVMEVPYGKAVDAGGLASLGIAATSENIQRTDEQDDRLQRIEQALGLTAGLKGRK